jgi:hypothetical protein
MVAENFVTSSEDRTWGLYKEKYIPGSCVVVVGAVGVAHLNTCTASWSLHVIAASSWCAVVHYEVLVRDKLYAPAHFAGDIKRQAALH